MRSLTLLQERTVKLFKPHSSITDDADTTDSGGRKRKRGAGVDLICTDPQTSDVFIAATFDGRTRKPLDGIDVDSDDMISPFVGLYQVIGAGTQPIRDDVVERTEVARLSSISETGDERSLVSLQHVPDSSCLCLAFSNGDLYVIRNARGRAALDEEVDIAR